jgi:hypothetical protein
MNFNIKSHKHWPASWSKRLPFTCRSKSIQFCRCKMASILWCNLLPGTLIRQVEGYWCVKPTSFKDPQNTSMEDQSEKTSGMNHQQTCSSLCFLTLEKLWTLTNHSHPSTLTMCYWVTSLRLLPNFSTVPISMSTKTVQIYVDHMYSKKYHNMVTWAVLGPNLAFGLWQQLQLSSCLARTHPSETMY